MADQTNIETGPERAAPGETGSRPPADAAAVEAASPAAMPALAVEEDLLDLLYAPNVMEDWEGLRDLVDYMVKRKPHLAIFTNVLQNPLNPDEQVAFRHANRYVGEAFKKDGNFSDVGL